MSNKTRLDVLLVERGLEQTRQRAQAMIMSGLVFVDGQRVRRTVEIQRRTVAIEQRLIKGQRAHRIALGHKAYHRAVIGAQMRHALAFQRVHGRAIAHAVRVQPHGQRVNQAVRIKAEGQIQADRLLTQQAISELQHALRRNCLCK